MLRLRSGRDTGAVERRLGEKTAIKDVIEACGVPHTEVDLVVVSCGPGQAARPVALCWCVEGPITAAIYPAAAPPDFFPEVPRLQRATCERFVADGHLGKLARNLRLLGLDTAYERDADDLRLLHIMRSEGRALLTRDRPLLMHSEVRVGYCPRSSNPDEQTREVLRRFRFHTEARQLQPYTRCLNCNSLLKAIGKDEVRSKLADEPLTLKYYDQFRTCPGCGKLYWAGTHFAKLAARVESLRRHP